MTRDELREAAKERQAAEYLAAKALREKAKAMPPTEAKIGDRNPDTGTTQASFSNGGTTSAKLLYSASVANGSVLKASQAQGDRLKLDARSHIEVRRSEEVIPEIALEITFESIRINDQPFLFTVNGTMHEIAYDLSQRFDQFGRGLITLPMRTRDRKLKMVIEAENTGDNLDTTIGAFFYPIKVRNLEVSITCETQVENWYSSNPQPDSRFLNWIILDDIKIPNREGFRPLDTATFVYPPYPSGASGFVNDGRFGSFDGDKITGKLNGSISLEGSNNGANLFIFAPSTAISSLSDIDSFTYTTTYNFIFK